MNMNGINSTSKKYKKTRLQVKVYEKGDHTEKIEDKKQ